MTKNSILFVVIIKINQKNNTSLKIFFSKKSMHSKFLNERIKNVENCTIFFIFKYTCNYNYVIMLC